MSAVCLALCSRHFLSLACTAQAQCVRTRCFCSPRPCVHQWLCLESERRNGRLYVRPAPVSCRKVSFAWVLCAENDPPNSFTIVSDLKGHCQCLSSAFWILSIVMVYLPGLSESRVHLSELEEEQGSRPSSFECHSWHGFSFFYFHMLSMRTYRSPSRVTRPSGSNVGT